MHPFSSKAFGWLPGASSSPGRPLSRHRIPGASESTSEKCPLDTTSDEIVKSHVCYYSRYSVMVQQVLLTHYSRVFPSQYLLMRSLHLPTTRVWSLPKTPRHRAVAPQQCPGAIAPILAQSRDGPFLPESAEDSLHQAPRTEVTTHTLLPRFHTWRGNPDVLTRVGSFHGRGPTPPLLDLACGCSPPCGYCLMILRGNLWEKPRSVPRDFSGFPGIKFCCWLWGWEVHFRSPGRFRRDGQGAGGAPCLASALDPGHLRYVLPGVLSSWWHRWGMGTTGVWSKVSG